MRGFRTAQRGCPRAVPTRSRTAGHGTTQSSDGCNPRPQPCRPSCRRPARGSHGLSLLGRAAVAGCHPFCPEPSAPARVLFRAHRWDLGAKHADLLTAFSTGSWPTSNGAAESRNRDGTWTGSEQSCRPTGNCRPSQVTVCGRCSRIGIGAELDLVNHPGARLAGKLRPSTTQPGIGGAFQPGAVFQPGITGPY